MNVPKDKEWTLEVNVAANVIDRTILCFRMIYSFFILLTLKPQVPITNLNNQTTTKDVLTGVVDDLQRNKMKIFILFFFFLSNQLLSVYNFVILRSFICLFHI